MVDTAFVNKRLHPGPYEDAPRLGEDSESPIDWRNLVSGEWLEIEVGPGRGWFLVERAREVPQAALLGFEVRRKWASIVDRRLATLGLQARVRNFAEDALEALARLSPEKSVRRIWLHFPDPWWKKRHEKRLVMGEKFLDQVTRLLEPGGELFVQTDVEERAASYRELLDAHIALTPHGDAAGSPVLLENPYEARSPRERRAMKDQIPVYRLRYRTKN